MVVPDVLVANITNQNTIGTYFFNESCTTKKTKKTQNKIIEEIVYPIFKVIENRSPAVSPSVVAIILVIQKSAVNSGIFFKSI